MERSRQRGTKTSPYECSVLAQEFAPSPPNARLEDGRERKGRRFVGKVTTCLAAFEVDLDRKGDESVEGGHAYAKTKFV